MLNWRKSIAAVLLCGSFVFAQFDDASEESYSYGSDTSEESINQESDQPSVGEASASDDEWKGFNYEEMGLTQWEFQQAKQEGISRDKLTRLVELGVRPSEYIQRPWEKMGVSEEEWLGKRSKGLEDADIDRSYRYRNGNQSYAYLSLLVPSLYQWKTDNSTKAIWMDVLWVGSLGATIYLAADGNSAWWYGLLPLVAAHIWSFADAFFGTQWDSNPDANRFSYGIIPSPARDNAGMGVTGFFNVKF
ncbi:MAG: hypothetical protein HUK19_06355 [Fibrobacter sp.]|nr:hypothetical protein [Fibrobacter sp.]